MGLQVPQELQNTKLKDLVGEDGNWNWKILSPWMSVMVMQKIKAVHPPSNEYGKDEFSVSNIGNQGASISYLYSRRKKEGEEEENGI